MKKTLIAGNWKMNKTPSESVEFVKQLTENIKKYEDRDILICPPFTSIPFVSQVIKEGRIKLGAQNMYFEEEGAFTGEISPTMLKEINVEYVICGHSERRNVFGESNETINEKIKKVLKYEMIPILCIGEKLDERESGETFKIIQKQLDTCLANLSENMNKKVVIAYEPIWAIGTGKTATPSQAEEVHAFIRDYVKKNFTEEVAENLIILYGGSVKPDNVDSIMAEQDIDGVLVGGASLKIDSFLRIIDYK